MIYKENKIRLLSDDFFSSTVFMPEESEVAGLIYLRKENVSQDSVSSKADLQV